MGNLVFQATLGGQVNLVGPNTASTFNLNVPAVAGTLVTTGDTGTVTNTMCATSVYTAPGTIGSGTPNTGAFTTLSATGVASFAAGSAAAPAITRTGDTDTGIFFPAANTLAFSTNGTEDARFDSAGNFGLGVTPSAWGSAFKAIQVGTQAAFSTDSGVTADLVLNAHQSGSNWIYKANGNATLLRQESGVYKFFNAASGTAGNAITFTQAMTLDASGNLGVGVTNPSAYSSKFVVGTSAGGTSATFTDATNYTFSIKSGGNGVSLIGGEAGNALAFQTGASERARIDTSGNLLVGTTSQVTSGLICAVANAGVKNPIVVKNTGSAGAGIYFQYFVNSSETYAGGIAHSASTTTLYLTASDYRLKENIAPMTGALAKVAQLKPVTYTWKEDGTATQGFIAHELQEVVPECVAGEKDAVDADGNPKYQGVDTSFLVATLTAAIQEQQALIVGLREELDAVKTKVGA